MKLFYFPFLLLFSFILISCSASISDTEIAEQVKNYLDNDSREGGLATVEFSKFFKVANVTVTDKLIKDKEMTAICEVTIQIKRNYQNGSQVTYCYGFIVGDESGSIGQERMREVKFIFENYESGWRIKGVAK